MKTKKRDKQLRRMETLVNGTATVPLSAAPTLRLDLGCGSNKKAAGPGETPWYGVDAIAFPGVDLVCNLAERRLAETMRSSGDKLHPTVILGKKEVFSPWPWEDDSVAEVHCSHFLEHLTNLNDKWERVHFFNELHRVLAVGHKATIIIPHWCSNRYYGDPTHKEPFSEMGFFYLLREWRLGNPAKGAGANAPAVDISNNPHGYSCDFDATWGYSLHPEIAHKNEVGQQFAMTFYKEAAQDIIATLTKR